jgi:hypothetical protein
VTGALPDGPPSTVAEIRQVITDFDADSARSRQVALGPSELGTPCVRQIAMKLAGVPKRREGRPPWAPLQGTAVHALMEDVLKFHNGRLGRPRWVIEQRVDLDGELAGRGDAFDTDTGIVVDWKHAGVTTLKSVNRMTLPVARRVRPEYRVQAHLYGYGHERAGRKVNFVRLVFLARSHDYDASTEWTEAYRRDVAEWALTRYYAVRDAVAEGDMAAHPERLAEIPAAPSSSTCQYCPFKRPGVEADGTGCRGYESDLDRPVSEWLASLPTAG